MLEIAGYATLVKSLTKKQEKTPPTPPPSGGVPAPKKPLGGFQ